MQVSYDSIINAIEALAGSENISERCYEQYGNGAHSASLSKALVFIVDTSVIDDHTLFQPCVCFPKQNHGC